MLQTPIYAMQQSIGLASTQAGIFNQSATFYARPGDPGETLDAYGAVILADYQPVTGLESLACMFAPEGPPPNSDTKRTQEQYDTTSEWHLTLKGYYPAVEQRYLVRVDGGDLYQVMATESDSQSTMTRCAVRKYEI